MCKAFYVRLLLPRAGGDIVYGICGGDKVDRIGGGGDGGGSASMCCRGLAATAGEDLEALLIAVAPVEVVTVGPPLRYATKRLLLNYLASAPNCRLEHLPLPAVAAAAATQRQPDGVGDSQEAEGGEGRGDAREQKAQQRKRHRQSSSGRGTARVGRAGSSGNEEAAADAPGTPVGMEAEGAAAGMYASELVAPMREVQAFFNEASASGKEACIHFISCSVMFAQYGAVA